VTRSYLALRNAVAVLVALVLLAGGVRVAVQLASLLNAEPIAWRLP